MTLEVPKGDEDEDSWLQSDSQSVSDLFNFSHNGKIGQKDAAHHLRMWGNKLMELEERREEGVIVD